MKIKAFIKGVSGTWGMRPFEITCAVFVKQIKCLSTYQDLKKKAKCSGEADKQA